LNVDPQSHLLDKVRREEESPVRRHRRAKIVATLGPSSSDETTIRSLFETGVDVFRFNFSHGSHAEHRARHEIIRGIEADLGRPIGILMDLQGPKLRLGDFREGAIDLVPGQSFRLDLSSTPGDGARASVPHPEIFAALETDAEILLDDGKVRLRVVDHGPEHAETEVVTAGTLSNHKGLNLPGVTLPISAITEKDQEDLAFGLDLGVDWVGLSFVQGPDDVATARRFVTGRAGIMAKLEKPKALDHLEEIIDLSDAIMVARGDLGVELAPEDVPAEQKRIVRNARRAGKPVVIATQMLESMLTAPAPTRAEASDVATAVYDGADALMLSGESAAGQYPREAVAMMNRIIEHVERDPAYRRYIDWQQQDPEATPADAITAAARQVAETLDAASIVTYTTSGSTALRAARERPNVPVLVLTPERSTARRLSLLWGVHCVHTEDATGFTDMVLKACHIAQSAGYAKSGDRIVVTAGVPFGTPGATNVLRIAWVTGEGRG
jgi:pyruvate kinase